MILCSEKPAFADQVRPLMPKDGGDLEFFHKLDSNVGEIARNKMQHAVDGAGFNGHVCVC